MPYLGLLRKSGGVQARLPLSLVAPFAVDADAFRSLQTVAFYSLAQLIRQWSCGSECACLMMSLESASCNSRCSPCRFAAAVPLAVSFCRLEVNKNYMHPRPLHTLRGHVRELTAVALSDELSVAASVNVMPMPNRSKTLLTSPLETKIVKSSISGFQILRERPMDVCFCTQRIMALSFAVSLIPEGSLSRICSSQQSTADL